MRTGECSATISAGLRIALFCLALTAPALAQPAGDNPERAIANLRGDLYVARFDGRATLFLVTPDGIVLTDPLGPEAAKWLRGEFAQRFPGLTVRYVLISHHHFDRAGGAAIFDGAETIAHRLFNKALGSLRSSTVYVDVKPVKRTFDQRQRVTIGGRTVEMVYVGPAHAPDMAAIYFPDERVVLAVDTLDVGRVPYSFGPYSPFDVEAWLDTMVALDADLVVDGAGRTTGPAALRELQPYVHDLVEAVAAGVAAGRTRGQLHSEVLLPAHRANPNYAARVAQIDRTYQSLSLRSLNASLAGSGSLLPQTSYCAGYLTCSPFGGLLAGGTVGLEYWVGRVGVDAEFGAGQQLVLSRSSSLYEDAVSNRRSTTSVFARYRLSRARIGADVILGATAVASDTRGLYDVRQAEAPLGGRHSIVSSRWLPGIITGVDFMMSVGSRWSIRVPVRFSSVFTDDDVFHPGQAFQVGAGLSYRLTQRLIREHGPEEPVVGRTRSPAPAKHP